jgi:hypothetical protein
MRRLLLAVPFALIASTAFAAGWESGMQEDEGGPVMMAWVFAGEGNAPPELRMFCGDQVSLRYGQVASEGAAPILDPVSVTFDFGDDVIALDMQYEDLDGMYAAYFPADSLIIGFLRSQQTVAVDLPSGPWPVQEFTLAGSSKAIAAVLKSCN